MLNPEPVYSEDGTLVFGASLDPKHEARNKKERRITIFFIQIIKQEIQDVLQEPQAPKACR